MAGIDHVSIGADFYRYQRVIAAAQGIADLDGQPKPGRARSTFAGMENSEDLPGLTAELRRRGLSEGDLRKIYRDNALAVIAAVVGAEGRRAARHGGMRMATFDVIVAGLGAMGSAAAHQLAARGQRVLGLEQYTEAHDRGSSHGGSRIIRMTLYKERGYVRLLHRAFELWRQLERQSGESLLTITGGLAMGRPDHSVIDGRAAQRRGVRHRARAAGSR